MKQWKNIGGTVYRSHSDREENRDTISIQQANGSYHDDFARQQLAERVTHLLNNDSEEGDTKLIDAIMNHKTKEGSRVGDMLTSEVTGNQLRRWLREAIAQHAGRSGFPASGS